MPKAGGDADILQHAVLPLLFCLLNSYKINELGDQKIRNRQRVAAKFMALPHMVVLSPNPPI
jgi:hypothetical protein